MLLQTSKSFDNLLQSHSAAELRKAKTFRITQEAT